MADNKKKKTAGKKAVKTTENKKTSGNRQTNRNSQTTANRQTGRNKRKERSPYSDEAALIITLVLSILVILSYFNLCGIFGKGINFVLFGLFGFAAYLLPVIFFFGVAFAISNRGLFSAKIKIISSCFVYWIIMGFLQLITYEDKILNPFQIFLDSAKQKNGGGFFGCILSDACSYLFGKVGSYIVYAGVTSILLMFITEKLLFAFLREKHRTSRKKREERKMEEEDYIFSEEENERTSGRNGRKAASVYTFSKENKDNLSIFRGYEKKEQSKEEVRPVYEEEMLQKFGTNANTQDVPEDMGMTENSKEGAPEDDIQIFRAEENAESTENVETKDKKDKIDKIEVTESKETVETAETEGETENREPIETIETFVDENTEEQKYFDIEKETEAKLSEEVNDMMKEKKEPVKAPTAEENKAVSDEIEQAMQVKKKEYCFPSIDLLTKPKGKGGGVSDADLRETAAKLKNTLDSFGVEVEMKNISCGPTVTRYELQPAMGVKVSKITSLTDDIKLSLAAADIRIEAPIPGKAAVGIEVPNKEVSMVYLRSLLESREFKEHKSNIAFAVGKDIGGNTIVTDIAKMPHLLIAGATGSGKSVCINTLIMSILYKANPDDVKLIMIDPKVVELSVYNGIPHLLIPVVTEPKKASGALNWAVMEMTERYKRFADLGVRDIKGYNAKVAVVEEEHDERFQKMPQIVIIVDELADLMMVAPGEVEDAICRLAQLARAAGIHLIIATQRPSVNVITGLIKANVPSRIAFAVSSAVDSRTILDGGGAEKLLGNGDMLFFPSGYPKPIRVQGSYVSDKEVSAVVDFLKGEYGTAEYNEEVNEKITQESMSNTALANGDSNFDDYFAEAGRFVIEKDKASIGMLQRVYKIGFNRAARIMDQLYDAGVVGPEEGTKPRKVIMSAEEFERYIEEYV